MSRRYTQTQCKEGASDVNVYRMTPIRSDLKGCLIRSGLSHYEVWIEYSRVLYVIDLTSVLFPSSIVAKMPNI